jgi:hypothetical protein
MFRDEDIAVLMKIFSLPFNIAVNKVPKEFQMELIEMQNSTDLKMHFFLYLLKISINLMLILTITRF